MIEEQQAKLASPAAMSFSLARSSAIQGEPELAQLHLADLQFQRMMQMLQMMQLQAVAQPQGAEGAPPQGGGGPPQGGGGGGGMAPQALPFMAQNATPPQGISNPGPNRPPGAPRPGAQGPEVGV